MSRALDGLAAQSGPVAPKHSLDPTLLDVVLAALASPPPGAAAAWRHPRRRRIVEAIAALAPTDGMQAMLVAQIVGTHLLVEEVERRAGAPTLAPTQVAEMHETMEEMTRKADRLMRLLRRVQRRPGAPCDTAGRFDWLTEGAVGGSDALQSEAGVVGPIRPRGHGRVAWPDQVRT